MKTITLQSQDKFDEIAILDLDNGTVSVHQKANFPDTASEPKQGCFSVQGNAMVCFFRIGEELHLRLGERTIKFQENDRILLKPVLDDQYLFSIQRDHETILTWEYTRQEIYPPISAFQMVNHMASEEDFDIFVLVRNVINNIVRKKRVFTKFKNSS